jgi:transcriptional regulator
VPRRPAGADVTGPGERHAPAREADVARLVREHPLAWVCTAAGEDWRATLLPLRPEPADDDRPIGAFLGHFAAGNPQVALLRRVPRAVLLFAGVHGYVSPSWLRDRTQAPTWNYASAQYLVDVEWLGAEAERDRVLAAQVADHEAGRERAWDAREMGPRYAALARRVVAFRARVRERRAKFKLGQDERDDVYADIGAALGREGQDELRAWMAAANPSRPER